MPLSYLHSNFLLSWSEPCWDVENACYVWSEQTSDLGCLVSALREETDLGLEMGLNVSTFSCSKNLAMCSKDLLDFHEGDFFPPKISPSLTVSVAVSCWAWPPQA